MGQHASTESVNTSAYPEIGRLWSRNGMHRDSVLSEDETMVDVSPASSMLSNRTRTSREHRRISSVSRTSPSRNPPGTSSGNGSRPSRRSSLWCRVQSLRNRIYRTTRSVNIVERDNSDGQISSSRPTTLNPLTRRHTFRNSILGISQSENRRSGVFGSPSNIPSRPFSFHPRPDPFVDNIDPRYENIEELNERQSNVPTSESQPPSTKLRRRSIWGQPSSTSASTRPALAISPPTLPSVIDHSTQTTGLGHHPITPFNITRRPGEDQAEMLSRFLYVAGAALAASLVGSTDSTTSQLQDFSADFADASLDDLAEAPEGSFEGFLRALRQGRAQFAQALRSDPSNSVED